jgi:mono/diheme cytochrome c family protein
LNSLGKIPSLSDSDLFDIVKYGGQPFSPLGYKNDMPGFEMQLDDARIWEVLSYIKSRWIIKNID